MTITINLEPEKEARLRKLAAEAGQTMEAYVIDLVMRRVDELDAEERAEQGERTSGNDIDTQTRI